MTIRVVSRYEDTTKDPFWIRPKIHQMLFYGDYCRNNNNNNIMNVSNNNAPWVGWGWVGDGLWPLALTGYLSRRIHKIAD